LKRIFEPKREEATGRLRILHDEKISNLYYSPNIVRATESRRIIWTGQVTSTIDMKFAYKSLVDVPEGNRTL
jgi:hypothetical protein